MLILFALRETPQASTGFTPFELVYSRCPQSLLQLMKDGWSVEPPPQNPTSPADHIWLLQDKLALAHAEAQWNLAEAQWKQKARYGSSDRSPTK